MFVGGWTLMTVAMMLPTVTPLIVMFSRAVRGARGSHPSHRAAVRGYLGIWILAGVIAYAGVLAIRALALG